MQRKADFTLLFMDGNKPQLQTSVTKEELKHIISLSCMSINVPDNSNRRYYFGTDTNLGLTQAARFCKNGQTLIQMPVVFYFESADIVDEVLEYKKQAVIAIKANTEMIEKAKAVDAKFAKTYILEIDTDLNCIYINFNKLKQANAKTILAFAAVINKLKNNLVNVWLAEIPEKLPDNTLLIQKQGKRMLLLKKSPVSNNNTLEVEKSPIIKNPEAQKDNFVIKPLRTAMSLTFFPEYPARDNNDSCMMPEFKNTLTV